MLVAIISQGKAEELTGIEYENGINYNPVQLPDERWFISFPEAQFLNEEDIIAVYNYTPVHNEEI